MKTTKMAVILGFMLAPISSSVFAHELLVDSDFNKNPASAGLRANSAGQDWFESRQDDPSLLTIDRTVIGSNATAKAKFEESSDRNAYLTQEFSFLQRQTLSAQWDIYVDSIVNLPDKPDRAGWMLIGDNTGTDYDRTGPNAEDGERFVYMAFYKNGGGTIGTMDLVARDRDDSWTTFTTVATGLKLKQWHTIKVNLDLAKDTYEVYVNGQYKDTLTSRTAKNCVTHISFAQWNDGAGAFYVDNVTGNTDFSFYSAEGAPDPAQDVTGKFVREWWLNIDGTAVSDLTRDPRYPDSPDGAELIDQFEGPIDWADNYGTRLYGYITAPATGDYMFRIAGDDSQELYLSTDSNPANAVLIAEVPGWTNSREWDKYSEQTSEPIFLKVGHKYYIEALGKENEGSDSTAVSWQPPGGVQELIPGIFSDTYEIFPTEINSYPAPGALVINQQIPELSWYPTQDENITLYNVYLGTSPEEVAVRADHTYMGSLDVNITAIDPGALDPNQDYYWAVDMVDVDGVTLEGQVWSFSTTRTGDFLPLDDFETYLIAEQLPDNWSVDVDATDRTVLSLEETIVYSGTVSMALTYYNLREEDISRVLRTFRSEEQDLTLNKGDTLSLRVRGNENNDQQRLSLTLTDVNERSHTVVYPNLNIVRVPRWVDWRIPLKTFSDANVDVTAVKTMAIGVDDQPLAFEPIPIPIPNWEPYPVFEFPNNIIRWFQDISVQDVGKIYIDCIRVINLSGPNPPVGFWGHVCDASNSGQTGISEATIVFTRHLDGVDTGNAHPSPGPGEYYISVPDSHNYTVTATATGYEDGSFNLEISGTDPNGQVDMQIGDLRWVTCEWYDSGVAGCAGNGLIVYLIPKGN